MSTATRSLALLAAIATLAVVGCGSSGEGSTTGGTSGEAPSAAPPSAPPGASAQSCAPPAGITELTAHGVGCSAAAGVTRSWSREKGCLPAPGASRSACGIERWRCLAVEAQRGVAVSCAASSRSIAFIARR